MRCLTAESTVVRLEDQLKSLSTRQHQIEDLEFKVSQVLKHNTELLH
jgi:hypothetical protein